MSNEETVTISQGRYNQLIDMERVVHALLATGVEKWEGYDAAGEYYERLVAAPSVVHKFEDMDRNSGQSFRDFVTKVEGVDLSNPPEADAAFTAAMDNGAIIKEGHVGLLAVTYSSYRNGGDALGLDDEEIRLWDNYASGS